MKNHPVIWKLIGIFCIAYSFYFLLLNAYTLFIALRGFGMSGIFSTFWNMVAIVSIGVVIYYLLRTSTIFRELTGEIESGDTLDSSQIKSTPLFMRFDPPSTTIMGWAVVWGVLSAAAGIFNLYNTRMFINIWTVSYALEIIYGVLLPAYVLKLNSLITQDEVVNYK